VLQSSWR